MADGLINRILKFLSAFFERQKITNNDKNVNINERSLHSMLLPPVVPYLVLCPV